MDADGHRSGGRSLKVIVGDARGRPLRMPGLSVWLRRVAPAAARGSVGVTLVSDRRMQRLNRTYRQLDYATDVLSFPAEPPPASRQRRGPRDGGAVVPSRARRFLGDIVIARGVARRQARHARHSELAELRLLALHGLLHLLGYDHDTDQGRMRRAERRLRAKGGLPSGLLERAEPARRGGPGAGLR
jgi:probable rRNA maturation factor